MFLFGSSITYNGWQASDRPTFINILSANIKFFLQTKSFTEVRFGLALACC
jgi:hypothetical protein